MYIKTLKVLAFGAALPLAAIGMQAIAADPSVEEKLASQLPGLEAENISPAPLNGIYEIAIGTEVAYISEDGRYLIKGEIIDLTSNENLTARRKDTARTKVLAEIDPADAITFSPAEVEHQITVFTDIDCGYCRKLHREMDQLNEMGVSVQYLFFPRSGPNTPSWEKAENVWCAKDRNDALTKAKAGETPDDLDCATPIEKQYQLGRMVGLRGTPAIVTESGELIAGYLPAAQLVERLKSSKQFAAAAAAR